MYHKFIISMQSKTKKLQKIANYNKNISKKLPCQDKLTSSFMFCFSACFCVFINNQARLVIVIAVIVVAVIQIVVATRQI